ncbi:MAG: hypothetical protein KAY24_02810, partial [Candidatus Eisenbacteria sp.]|nr:hypothetical protein [Candidatus Eisenbacteria bacterium]
MTVNEAKTHLCHLPDESVDFLGYTICYCYWPATGRAYIGTCPPRKSIQRVCQEVSGLTCRRWLLLDAEERVARLNRVLRGWSNYFCLGPVSKAYRSVDQHARRRLRQWLRGKHKVRGEGTSASRSVMGKGVKWVAMNASKKRHAVEHRHLCSSSLYQSQKSAPTPGRGASRHARAPAFCPPRSDLSEVLGDIKPPVNN